MSERKRITYAATRNLALLLLAVIIPLGGFLVTEKFGEPYPWLVMPGFAGSGLGEDDTVRSSKTYASIQFEDGSNQTLDLATLFEPAPARLSGHIYSMFFKNGDPSEKRITSSPAKKSLGTWIKDLLQPGYYAAQRNKRPLQVLPETQQWLAQRLKTLFPEKAATQLSFVNTSSLYNPDGQVASDQATTSTIERTIHFTDR